MSSSGYVAVPRCSVIFDGTNYAEFAGFMRIHMRGLLLWGVLSGEVPCPPCPIAPVAPTPPAPLVLAADASQADRDAPRLSMILQLMPMISRCQPIRMPFLPIVMICLLTLSGAMMMLVLLLFSLRVSSLSLLRSSWVSAQLPQCGLIFVSAISPLVMLSTYL